MAEIALRRSRVASPSWRALATRPSSSMTPGWPTPRQPPGGSFRACSARAHLSGARSRSERAMMAASGMTPPPRPLPITRMSGATPNCSHTNIEPVRPRQLGTLVEDQQHPVAVAAAPALRPKNRPGARPRSSSARARRPPQPHRLAPQARNRCSPPGVHKRARPSRKNARPGPRAERARAQREGAGVLAEQGLTAQEIVSRLAPWKELPHRNGLMAPGG